MSTNLDPAVRAEFLELIKDLCDLVPDRNLNRLEKAVRKLLPAHKAGRKAKGGVNGRRITDAQMELQSGKRDFGS